MAYKERVYSRKLKQPLPDEKKPILSKLILERLGSNAPGMTVAWHPTDPVMTVKAKMVVFTIRFTLAEMTVDCEYGWIARQFVTDTTRTTTHAAVHKLCDDADI